jgi:hypothetical protein
MQHSLRHDVRLRAAVRDTYELAFLPPEHPPFEEAERKRTAEYVEALEAERYRVLAGREMILSRQQLALI